MNGRWDERVAERVAAIDAAGRGRRTRSFDALGQSGSLDDRPVVSFGGNDYLGLSEHPEVISAAVAAARRWGTGSTGARLLVGTRPVHHELETELAEWKGTAAALVYPTGYQANVGVLSALADSDTTIFSDELNHASIIDGCRMSRSRVAVYRHCDVDHLDSQLAAADGPCIVVTDSVFSMDGDVAPIDDLVGVCAERDALLVLDEAHGVLGPTFDVTETSAPVIRVGTLSKMLGSLGGFVAASQPIVDLLLSTSRSFIFTTALSPADAAAALAALRVLRSVEGEQLASTLRHNVDRLAPGHPSPIVPIVVGDETRAMRCTDDLLARGLFVPAVRPPTVAPGTSRLRVAVSAAHTEEAIDRLVDALGDLGLTW